MKKPPKDYLTAKEAAAVLHVSERTIMRYIKTKRLLATKIGQWRIKKADIDRLINPGRVREAKRDVIVIRFGLRRRVVPRAVALMRRGPAASALRSAVTRHIHGHGAGQWRAVRPAVHLPGYVL